MLVELLRLLVTLVFTAIGYLVGGTGESGSIFGPDVEPANAQLIGAVIGAAFGYVSGGVFGRGFFRRLETLPQRLLPKASGADLFAGAFGLVVGLTVGAVVSAPIIALVPGAVAWPLAALIVTLAAAFSSRLFAQRSHDLLTMAGLRPQAPLVARRLDDETKAFVIDSSAAIDGRILELAKSGLFDGRLWLPYFVIDELQGLADAGEKSRRQRGRRGLEMLEALRSTASVDVTLLEDAIPEFEEVDAKLLAVAERAGASLVTTDTNLARAAELRGIRVINPAGIGENLKPAVAVGSTVTVPVSKAGSEPGQGVGYLADGTMVVIEGAADRIGEEIDVEVTSTTRTAVGRLLFGRPA